MGTGRSSPAARPSPGRIDRRSAPGQEVACKSRNSSVPALEGALGPHTSIAVVDCLYRSLLPGTVRITVGELRCHSSLRPSCGVVSSAREQHVAGLSLLLHRGDGPSLRLPSMESPFQSPYRLRATWSCTGFAHV